MAKVTKKSSKKSKSTKKTEEHKVAAPVPEGMISLIMGPEDMKTFANLLSIASQTFEQLALQAAKENDETSFAVLQARGRLSAMFANKLVDACRMPEPISRDFH